MSPDKMERRSLLKRSGSLVLVSFLHHLIPQRIFAFSAAHMRRAKKTIPNLLWSWGYGASGRLGSGSTSNRTSPAAINNSGDTISSMAAGGGHSVFVKGDGSLNVMGLNDTGQLGIGNRTNTSLVTLQGTGTDTNWAKVAAGPSHSLAIKNNGTLWAFGANTLGQLGTGTITSYSSPISIGSLSNWAKVFGSLDNRTFAIKTDGTLWAWGDNAWGQLGDGTYTHRSSPVQIGSATNWVKTVSAFDHTLGLQSDGSLWAWGIDDDCQLGINHITPTQAALGAQWTMISCRNHDGDADGDDESAGGIAIRSDGTLWGWGNNYYGQVGDGTTYIVESPVLLSSATNWTWVSASAWSSLAIKGGALWIWGYNYYGQLGVGSTATKSTPVQVGSATDWWKASSGGLHVIALKTDGTLWAWGYGAYGRLGNGATTNRSSPIQIGSASNWAEICAGGEFNLALKNDGTLWAWGDNGNGQLGIGSTTDKSTPTQVGLETTWVKISAAGGQSAAIRSDGSLWTWGYNADGQLGIGNTTNYSSPVNVASFTTWYAVSCGSYNIFAIASNKTLWSSGFSSGQWPYLGATPTSSRSSFTQIGSLSTWASIAGGQEGGYALQADGTFWSWGAGVKGHLANSYITPTRIDNGTTWSDIAVASYSSLAIKTDGTLWSWGARLNGVLGIASPEQYNTSPLQVTGTNWSRISAGSDFSVALKTTGAIWSWGLNDNGELGNGTTTLRSTPVQTGSATYWVDITAGANHTLAKKT